MIEKETLDDTSSCCDREGNTLIIKESFENGNGIAVAGGSKGRIQDIQENKIVKGRICFKLQDKVYRSKLIETICLGIAFVFLGWLFGQSGPSFLDLIHVTGTDIGKGSAFVTSGFAGYLIGALLTGFLYDRYNKHFLISMVSLGCSIFIAAVPWCSIYEVMVVDHALVGLFRGALIAMGNAQCLVVWGVDNGPYLQSIQFAFSVGGIIAPLAAAPFLLPRSNNSVHGSMSKHQFENYSILNETLFTNYSKQIVGEEIQIFINDTKRMDSSLSYLNIVGDEDTLRHIKCKQDSHISNTNNTPPKSNLCDIITSEILHENINHSITSPKTPSSRIYVAYFINAGIGVSAALAFFMLYLKSRRHLKKNVKHADIDKVSTRKISRNLKILALANMMMILAFYGTIEGMMVQYLSVFCVTYLNWSKYDGSTITSIFWVAFSLGRFAGIFLIRMFNYVNIFCFFNCFFILDIIVLLICSLYKADTGVWVFAPLTGLGMSVMYPLVYTWTKAELVPMTGRISSLFVIGNSWMKAINPLLIGYLMEEVSAMYFCYLSLGYSIIMLLFVLSGIFITRKVNAANKGHLYTDQEVHISLGDN